MALARRDFVARLRFGLDLFANMRPVKLYDEYLTPLKGKTPEHLDMIVVRVGNEGWTEDGGKLVSFLQPIVDAAY